MIIEVEVEILIYFLANKFKNYNKLELASLIYRIG